jgi:hypothetical protein
VFFARLDSSLFDAVVGLPVMHRTGGRHTRRSQLFHGAAEFARGGLANGQHEKDLGDDPAQNAIAAAMGERRRLRARTRCANHR